MSTLLSSGSTLTDGTEQTLVTDTTDKTYVFGINLEPLRDGNVLKIKIYTKMLTGSTERLAYEFGFSDLQSAPNQYTIPVLAKYSYKVTMQITGTNRTLEWGVFHQ